MVLRLATPLFDTWKRVVLAPAALVTWLVLSILTTLAGPFGSYAAFSLAVRAIYWPVLIGLGVLLGSAVRVLVETRMSTRGLWPGTLLIAVVNAVLFTPLLYTITQWLGEPGSRLPTAAEMAFFVFASSLGVGAMRNVMAAPATDTAPPSARVSPCPPHAAEVLPRLVHRLPEERRAPLLRLSVRDHYVVIHTALGTDTLLMRFADAMAETARSTGCRSIARIGSPPRKWQRSCGGAGARCC
ncbi:AlgR/AgrA/LytR family transcriptional regulator [Frigidibacter mobilis]|uniref:AlgR/AgrA/LytR family transcriptional regulator n=1 Tax=Frigidibacter mobilis TaxID=1335048 RepID=A0A159Z822_9RHOB|nr:AlgR/AgrA/LytR family transcriptional regulator [Frigidibacter mobilis]